MEKEKERGVSLTFETGNNDAARTERNDGERSTALLYIISRILAVLAGSDEGSFAATRIRRTSIGFPFE